MPTIRTLRQCGPARMFSNMRDDQTRRVRARHGKTRIVPLVLLTGLALLAVPLLRDEEELVAQDGAPSFAREVAPILYQNCTTCHRPGGLGPFSLLEYSAVKAHRNEIRTAVESGYMPPWHAEGPRGTFRNDRRLAEDDKATLLRWLDAGARKGSLRALPPTPVYPSSWELGTPDAVVSMTEDYMVPASGTVEYQYFEIPTGFTEDKWIQAIEFMPGAREVVHHVLVYAKVPAPTNPAPAPAAPAAGSPAPPQAPPLFLDKPEYETPPDPPRIDSLHLPPRRLGTLIGGTAPGTNVMIFPAGTALRLRAGTVLTFQMHYTARGHAMNDRTSVGFRFAAAPPEEEIRMSAFINGAFTLPAGAKDIAVRSELEPTETVKIWGLLPHTHLRGTRWQYTLQKPDGTSEMILDIPRYDFDWQTYYFFATPLEITAGSKLKSVAWYDNSTSNRSKLDATKDVRWGDQTWEEMQYTAFLYSVNSRRRAPATR